MTAPGTGYRLEACIDGRPYLMWLSSEAERDAFAAELWALTRGRPARIYRGH